jgi:hypothetical protein
MSCHSQRRKRLKMKAPGNCAFRFRPTFLRGWPKIAGNPKTCLPDSGILRGVARKKVVKNRLAACTKWGTIPTSGIFPDAIDQVTHKQNTEEEDHEVTD